MTITLTRKEAQQVLDSLLDTMPFNEIEQRVHQAAIETLRTRLAQPEPEGYRWEEGRTPPSVTYTAPPKNEPVIDKTMATRIATQLGWQPNKEWVGLTDEEIYFEMPYKDTQFEFARAIEAKLKEKNT